MSEQRPTPETDAMFTAFNTREPNAIDPADFARKLERERDEARERAESKHGLWMAELSRVTELEKQLEAMREAINAANVGLQSAMQYILSLPYFGNLEELETTEKVQAALAKLKPLLP